jgi:hypothetical protein
VAVLVERALQRCLVFGSDHTKKQFQLERRLHEMPKMVQFWQSVR